MDVHALAQHDVDAREELADPTYQPSDDEHDAADARVRPRRRGAAQAFVRGTAHQRHYWKRQLIQLFEYPTVGVADSAVWNAALRRAIDRSLRATDAVWAAWLTEPKWIDRETTETVWLANGLDWAAHFPVDEPPDAAVPVVAAPVVPAPVVVAPVAAPPLGRRVIEDDDDEDDEDPGVPSTITDALATIARESRNFQTRTDEALGAAAAAERRADRLQAALDASATALASIAGEVADLKRAREEDKVERDAIEAERNHTKQKLWGFCCAVCNAVTPDRLQLPGDDGHVDAAPVVGTCADGHGICRDCLDAMIVARTRGGTDDAFKCCAAGCAHPVYSEAVLERASPHVYTDLVKVRAQEAAEKQVAQQAEREAAQAKRGEANTNFLASTVVSPCCGEKITGFDGCCSVICAACPRQFCAFCFEVSEPGDDMHAHLSNRCVYRKVPDAHGQAGSWYATGPRRGLLFGLWRAKQLEQLVHNKPELGLEMCMPVA